MKPVLPRTWQWVPIGGVLERRRDMFNPAHEPDRVFHSVGLEDIKGHGAGEVSVQTLYGSELASTKAIFSKGELLYGRLRPYLNKAAIAPCDGVCSTEIWVFCATPVIDMKYAFLVMLSPLILDRVSRITQGANLPRVEADAFDRLEIPLPPLSEQRRIVAMLEEDRAVRRLHRSADQLNAKLIPAIFHDMFGDPLTDHSVTTLGAIAEDFRYGTSIASSDVGYTTLRIPNVVKNTISFNDLVTVDLSSNELERLALLDGDVLFVRSNGNPDYIGRSAVFDRSAAEQAGLNADQITYASYLIRSRLKANTLDPHVLQAYLCSGYGRMSLLRRAKTSAGQYNINIDGLKSLSIPILPMDKQQIFLKRMQAVWRAVDTNDGAGVYRDLDASLLAYSFSGEMTSDWRDANQEQLEEEAAQRDSALKDEGVVLTRPSNSLVTADLSHTGRFADLTREQRYLLKQATEAALVEDMGSAFTITSLRDWLESPLDDLPDDALRRHLEVLVARGLMKLVSRPESDGSSSSDGRQGFGNVYRLVRENMTDESGTELVRGDELVRLARKVV